MYMHRSLLIVAALSPLALLVSPTSGFAACTLPSGATAGTCTYSGSGIGLTITDSNATGSPGAVRGIATRANGRGLIGNATGTNGIGGFFEALAPSSTTTATTALQAINSGGSTTAEGNYGSAGVFKITNSKSESPAVSITTNGINSYALKVVNTGITDNTVSYGPPDDFGGIAGFFQVSSASAQFGQAAVYAVNSGGQTGAGDNGRYGGGGFFVITNTNNFDSALVGQTRSVQGTGVEGDDFSVGTGGGVAVLGQSTAGLSAQFAGGSAGTGTCSYDGSSGWICPSDRNLKEHFVSVDLDAVLGRLDEMPVFYYQMKGASQPTVYLGPTAQDFKAAFGLGKNDTTINTANAQGVALAAAKGLYDKVKQDEARIAELEKQLAEQRTAMAEMKATLSRLAQGETRMKQASLTDR